MIGKFIGAAVGRKAANSIGSSVGGPIGAVLGYGLASRRFRGAALGGLAVMGGLALYRRLRGTDTQVHEPSEVDAQGDGMAVTETTDINGDPLPPMRPVDQPR